MKPNNQTGKQTLKEIENKLVDTITSLSYLKGRTNKHSKLIAHIYIRKATTQKQLRELTGYSLGTISNILQSLEKMGIVNKTQNPETREYSYEAEGSITQPGSRSVTNIFEYFSQQKAFIKKIKTKLAQPQLSTKKGYEEVNEFINKMEDIFPAIESATQKMLTQFSKQNRSEKEQ